MDLLQLPKEVIALIFIYLPEDSISNLSTVNKYINTIFRINKQYILSLRPQTVIRTYIRRPVVRPNNTAYQIMSKHVSYLSPLINIGTRIINCVSKYIVWLRPVYFACQIMFKYTSRLFPLISIRNIVNNSITYLESSHYIYGKLIKCIHYKPESTASYYVNNNYIYMIRVIPKYKTIHESWQFVKTNTGFIETMHVNEINGLKYSLLFTLSNNYINHCVVKYDNGEIMEFDCQIDRLKYDNVIIYTRTPGYDTIDRPNFTVFNAYNVVRTNERYGDSIIVAFIFPVQTIYKLFNEYVS